MSSLLEILMLTCFGFSWPISLFQNYRARTAAGSSPVFMPLVILGYVAGISAKLLSGNVGGVLVAYMINLVVVLLNLLVYFRNLHLDRMRKASLPK